MKRVFCILILISFGLSVWAQETSVYRLGPEIKKDSLGKFLTYYKDREQKVSIQDILADPDLYPFIKTAEEVPRFGLSESAFWLKIPIENSSDEKLEKILVIDDYSLFYVDYYLVQEKSVLDHQQSGIAVEPAKRSLDPGIVSFSIKLKGKEKAFIYLRITSHNFISFPIRVWDTNLFYKKRIQDKAILGTYYGFLITVVLLSLLFLFAVRLISFFYLIVFSACSGILTGGFDGFTAEYLFFLIKWTDGYQDVYIAYTSIGASLLFIKSYTRLPELSPRLNQWVNRYLILLLVVAIVSYLFPLLSFEIVLYIPLVYVFFIIRIVFWGISRGQRESYFILAAYAAVCLSVWVVVLSLFKLLPLTFFTMYGLHIGYVFQLLILLLALGDKIVAMKNEVAKKELEKELEKQELIAEQKRVLEDQVVLRTNELRGQKNNLRSLVENTEDMIWSLDERLNLIIMNSVARRKFKSLFQWEAQEGQAFLKELWYGWRLIWEKYYQRALDGEVYQVEIEMPEVEANQEKQVIMEFSFNPISGPNQEVLGLTVFGKDITELKNQEKLLIEKEANLRAILDHHDGYVMLINTDFQLLEFNEVFARALKEHSNIQLKKGMNLLECYDLSKEEEALWQERYQAAFLGKEQAFIEERIIDGQKTVSSIKLFPIRSARTVNRVSVFIEDITQLKEAEMQLKLALEKSEEQTRQLRIKERLLNESESLLKAVLNHLPLGVFWKDLQLNFIGGNRHFMEMLGYTKEEDFLGKDDFDVAHSGIEAEFFRKDDLEIIRNKEAKLNIEEVYVNDKGQTTWLSTTKVPLLDEYNEVFGVLVIVANITETKENQEALKKALSQAEEASRAKSLFLSTMSHEIRSPLNAVIGLSHLLLQDNPRPDQLEDLNILKFSAENLLALVNDILDYNKMEANKIELENIEFSLPSFLQSVYNSFLPKAREKKIDLRLDFPNQLNHTCIGDPLRLAQVLNNLISNAIKFTEKGFVRLQVDLLRETDEAFSFEFRVEDTGLGISEAQQDKVFESFQQANAGISRKYGGTGLGLTITRKILELLNSEIQLISQPEQGSVFYFSIRFLKGKKDLSNFALNVGNDPDQYRFSRQLRMLCVEDNPINQLLLRRFIHNWGGEIDFTQDGQEAIQLIESLDEDKRYDLIFMDLQMPVMDGYQAARHIRDLPTIWCKEVPILAFTASMMNDVQEKVKSSGMDGVMPKPFEPHELFQKIILFTERHHMDKLNPNFKIISP